MNNAVDRALVAKKRFITHGLLLWLVVCAAPLSAQRAEYWLDIDPGIGRATPATLVGENGSVALSTAGLAPGMHIVGIRTAQGRVWSQTYTHAFMVFPPDASASVSGAEYFIDTDPGVGLATAVAASGSLAEVTIPLSTADLAPGVHLLGLRAKQGANLWSQTYTHTFLVYKHSGAAMQVEAIEAYWDYEFSELIDIPFTQQGDSVVVEAFTLSTEDLLPGTHTLFVRAKADGKWGIPEAFEVIIPDVPSGLESLTTDSGDGLATRKVLINSTLLIIRGEKIYTATGQELK